MLRHAFVGCAVFMAFAVAPAYAQEVKLQLKFTEGEKFWVEDVVTSKQNVSVLGQDIKGESKTTTITSYAVKKVAPDSVVLEMKIEDVKAETDAGLGGDAGKIAEKTKGATLLITMTPDAKVKKVDGFAEFAKSLGGDPIANLIKESITEDMFINTIEQSFGFVPSQPVKKGDTWTRESKLALGPLGDFKTVNTFTYNGKGASGEEIGLAQKMEYIVPKGGAGAAMFKVVRGNMKSDKAEGVFIFDADKGRLVSSSSTMRIQGALTVDIGGMEVEMKLNQETSGKSRVLDKGPAKN